MDNYYTPEQVRDICNVNLETVYRWLRTKRLHGVKIGGSLWRISASELDRFLSEKAIKKA